MVDKRGPHHEAYPQPVHRASDGREMRPQAVRLCQQLRGRGRGCDASKVASVEPTSRAATWSLG